MSVSHSNQDTKKDERYVHIRYLLRFFDRWAHETMYAYIGNKHFFTKSCRCQTYQNSKISWQKCQFLTFKVNFLCQKLSESFSIFLTADFGVLVDLTMTWFSEEVFISNRCIHGFMCSAIKKSWKVSTIHVIEFVFIGDPLNLFWSQGRKKMSFLQYEHIDMAVWILSDHVQSTF